MTQKIDPNILAHNTKFIVQTVIKTLLSIFGFFWIIFMATIIICNTFSIGTDDTDISGWNRSEIGLHTDAKTGLQYLTGKNGGITPRLDINGNHMKKDYP